MQAHPTHRRVICGRCGAPLGGAPLRPQDVRGTNRLSPSARRKGDWDVPFCILSTATLRLNQLRSGSVQLYCFTVSASLGK